ncbi:MAG: type II toxin-antitoxin system RelE/ParE family toxin [Marivita sp.]|uniref:type II toxin-antitoxin system RelE/ParE family toxin n=1 Tax=Marivita sp. TaxID=2003365 RepID=UPI0025C3172F|nr:type II toxin-antitoxin system RelE/ParE family toxin [Marivita sp.]MCI5111645.1 type II toxin-antitoxin system RelE/ParE family toxin [Marivita sp.]
MAVTLRPIALRDIDAIRDHSIESWGVETAVDYMTGLFDMFDLLAETPQIGRLRSETSPPVRLHPYRSHNILYTDSGSGVEILRILHSRRNWAILLED